MLKNKKKKRKNYAQQNRPSKYILTHSNGFGIERYQTPGSFGGHSIPKGGHRIVSGIVRQKVKEEIRKEINEEYYERNYEEI